MNKEILKDVIIELFNGKYSGRYILDALVWGEQNTDIFWLLIKEYQPDYYNEPLKFIFSGNPIKVFTLMQDLKTRGIIK